MTRVQFAEIINLAVHFANMVSKLDDGNHIELEHLYFQDGMFDSDDCVIRVQGLEDDCED